MTEPTKENQPTNEKVLEGILKVLQDRQAPAVIDRPVFEKDLDFVDGKSLMRVIGTKAMDENKDNGYAINFGSKADTCFMPDETRIRLFNLKRLFSQAEIQAGFMFRKQNPSAAEIMETPTFKNQLSSILKAYNVTDFSSWIPTVQSRFYFEEFEIPYLLANEFDQMPMDSATITVPGDKGLLEGNEETDVATFTAQSTTQDSFTVTSRNNVVHTQITEDLMSDSAPKYIDKLRRSVVQGIARAYERCLINGDTTGTPRGATHFDTDIRALALNATFSKAFKGLRRLAYDAHVSYADRTYDHGGDTASKTLFENLLLKMGKFAQEKDDLIFVVSPTIETQVVTGAIPELFTAFALGGLASNVTGKMPPIFGVKSVCSPFMREDLNAAGVYESGKTFTAALCVKKSRFSNYLRQGIKVWAAPSLPSSDVMLMTAKARQSFAGNPQTDKEKSVVMAIDIATIA